MPRSAFPLSKSGGKAYRLGNRRWRLVKFSTQGHQCRVLINYHPLLWQYQAMLGVEVNGDCKVMASLEYHATHEAWHVHEAKEPIAEVPAGIRRGPWVKKVEMTSILAAWPIDDSGAFKIAVDYFGLDRTG